MENTIHIIKELFIYFYPLIILLGIIGNALSFFVFSSRKFRNTLFYVLFRVISITDTIAIVAPLHYFLTFGFSFDITQLSNVTCKLVDYVIYTSCPISSYILVYVSFDRMLNILKPNGFLPKLVVKKFHFSFSILIILFNMIYYAPILVYKQLEESISYNNETNKTVATYFCVYKDNGFIYWMDLFYSTIIPFIFMFIFTSVTIFTLFKSKKRTVGINSRDAKFALTSITLNICFFLFVFPLTLFLLISLYMNINEQTFELLFIILLSIFSINYANMFYVNMFVNSIFRSSFLDLVKRILRKFGYKIVIIQSTSAIYTISHR